MTAGMIGGVALRSKALLAPMAGVSDRAYRELCMAMGAGYCVSEMVSSKALSFGSKKSVELMEIDNSERPCGIQIFGDDPLCMVQAAESAMANKPDPALCGRLTEAVVRAVDVPVTVKIRKGWDDSTVNAVEVAKICEQAGAAAITIHGRTRQQFYKPPVDYDIIKLVKQSVSVPVIANGDIDSAKKAKQVLDYTGADFVMIGRASMGDPWLFAQINAFLDDPSQPLVPPSLEEKLDVMVAHVAKMVAYKGEYIAMRQARKLVMGYFKGLRGAASLRNDAGKLETMDDLLRLRHQVLTAQR